MSNLLIAEVEPLVKEDDVGELLIALVETNVLPVWDRPPYFGHGPGYLPA